MNLLIKKRWLCLLLLQVVSLGGWAQQKGENNVTASLEETSEHASLGAKNVDRLLNDFDALQGYIKRYDAMAGEQRLLLKLKTAELLERQALVIERLLELNKSDNSSILAADLTRLTSMLQDELVITKVTLSSMLKKQDQLRAEYEGAAPELALTLEQRMTQKEVSLNEIMTLQLRLINWLDAFAMDTSASKKTLAEGVLARSNELSLLINYANTRIEALLEERLEASEQENQRIDLELRRLSLKQASSVASLAILVSMMEQLSLDSDAYKEVLLTSTGAISEDIFEVRVLTRLLQRWTDTLISWFGENAVTLVVKCIVFFVILLAFSFISKLARKLITKTVKNSKLNFSQLLQDFFISIVGKVVFFIGLMIALSQLGLELAPLLAGFGIAGIVIGFALQGTLSNFASGMMILIYRPFDVGDMIIAGGIQGSVQKLSLVNATIQTIDNRRVVVPNNLIWDGVITNISAETLRRVDLVFGIGYGDDIEFAESVLMEEVLKHPMILKNPEPIVKLANLGESSVDFWVRPWVKNEDYWDVLWDLTRAVKLRFDKEGISIPFPQRDVHVYPTAQQASLD